MVVLLAPGFSPVDAVAKLPAASAALTGRAKPLKRLASSLLVSTGLKPGVNVKCGNEYELFKLACGGFTAADRIHSWADFPA